MRERARSIEDKQQRRADLLGAAEALASELGGVRLVTVEAVSDRAGLHRTGMRRYFANREELFLELAERGWWQWLDAIKGSLGDRAGLKPAKVADVVADTITCMPVFCDLLTHVPLSLEGGVSIERARKYKTNSFAAYGEIAATLDQASEMTLGQIEDLLATAIMISAGLWQVSHPAPTLARLYEQVPEWGHIALDFAPRLRRLLRATAVGLSTSAVTNSGGGPRRGAHR